MGWEMYGKMGFPDGRQRGREEGVSQFGPRPGQEPQKFQLESPGPLSSLSEPLERPGIRGLPWGWPGRCPWGPGVASPSTAPHPSRERHEQSHLEPAHPGPLTPRWT